MSKEHAKHYAETFPLAEKLQRARMEIQRNRIEERQQVFDLTRSENKALQKHMSDIMGAFMKKHVFPVTYASFRRCPNSSLHFSQPNNDLPK